MDIFYGDDLEDQDACEELPAIPEDQFTGAPERPSTYQQHEVPGESADDF